MMMILFLLAGLPVVGTIEYKLADDATEGWGVIHWPVLAGEPDVVDRINKALAYQTITGKTVAETAEYFQEYRQGITSSGYQVNYLDDEYQDISIYWEFVGAYPTGNETSLLFSLIDGRRLGPADLFKSESCEELVILCDEKLQQNIIQKMTDDPELHGYTTREEHHFQEENLVTVGIRSNGIHFFYNFDYPHALLAAEPSGDIFFEWNEIQDFLLPGVARNLSVGE